MRRSALNFAVDAIAFAGFVFMTATGVLLHFLLPPRSVRRATIWGLDRHDWGGVHYWTAVVLLGALSVHVLLHWKWIVHTVRGQECDRSGISSRAGSRWSGGDRGTGRRAAAQPGRACRILRASGSARFLARGLADEFDAAHAAVVRTGMPAGVAGTGGTACQHPRRRRISDLHGSRRQRPDDPRRRGQSDPAR